MNRVSFRKLLPKTGLPIAAGIIGYCIMGDSPWRDWLFALCIPVTAILVTMLVRDVRRSSRQGGQ